MCASKAHTIYTSMPLSSYFLLRTSSTPPVCTGGQRGIRFEFTGLSTKYLAQTTLYILAACLEIPTLLVFGHKEA